MSAAHPYVVAHVAVSLDGATRGFAADVTTYYALARRWEEDVTLTGADTILAQEDALAAGPGPGPAPDGPLLAVVDGRGRVGAWDALRAAGYWRDVLALRTTSTPPHVDVPGLRVLRSGATRVDLGTALATFAAEGARTVRVDTGGSLVAPLLADGLLDEVSLLVHPVLLPDADLRWWGSTAPSTRMELRSSEPLGGGLVHLCYAVAPSTAPHGSPTRTDRR